MTASLVAPPVATDEITRRQHRRLRNGAVAGGVALLIVAGGYEAANTLAPDLHLSGTIASVQPSSAVMGDMVTSVTGQYGALPSPPEPVRDGGRTVAPSRTVMRDLHRGIVGLYGHRHPRRP